MTVAEMKQITDVPVVIVDHHGLLTYVNSKFEEIFEWSTEESIGESMAMIMPANLRDAHNMGFARFLTGGESRVLNQKLILKAENKSGKIFDAHHFIIGEQIDGEWVFAATIDPV